ncbi:hypothetical protein GGP41_009507 [Bipolaris sorokiniana]|uniref:Uncharacterized protein n=1 Tax=Cochliobolus sativus TaxID=45130 RepID=A0A8H5ZAG1_COCSA|nr:hypothetical protein GGP41_009507 [Bipolaris sorokiniana]
MNTKTSTVTPTSYMNVSNTAMASSANEAIVNNENTESLSVTISFGVLGLVVAMAASAHVTLKKNG